MWKNSRVTYLHSNVTEDTIKEDTIIDSQIKTDEIYITQRKKDRTKISQKNKKQKTKVIEIGLCGYTVK